MQFKSRGSALLSALFLMTLIAIAATAMSTRLQLDIYRTHLSIQSEKIGLASQVVGFWAMDSLMQADLPLILLDDDGKVLDFPDELKKIYPGMQITGQVYDLQSRFNLNNLQNSAFQLVLLRLLTNTLKKVDLNDLKYIVNATVHWVSPYRLDTGFNQFLKYYSEQVPPYLPAYQVMQSVSEFRLVAGVTAKIYQLTSPMLTALPTQTQINLNTVSKQVFMALGDGFKESEADEFLQLRKEKGEFTSKDISLFFDRFKIPSEQVGIESEYYLSVAEVRSEALHLNRYVLIHRTKDRKGKLSVHVLRESFNAF